MPLLLRKSSRLIVVATFPEAMQSTSELTHESSASPTHSFIEISTYKETTSSLTEAKSKICDPKSTSAYSTTSSGR